MLSKGKRLNLKKDFKWVASGKRVDSKFITFFVKIGDNEQARVGIAVSSKHFKKATERNRARRLVSFVMENIYPKLSQGVNIVALPKQGILEVESKELLKDEKIIGQLN